MSLFSLPPSIFGEQVVLMLSHSGLLLWPFASVKQRRSFRGGRNLWNLAQYGAIQPAISLDILEMITCLFILYVLMAAGSLSPLQSSPQCLNHMINTFPFYPQCQTYDCVKAALQAYLHDTWSKRCCLWAQIEELSWQRCLNLGWWVGTEGRQSQRSTSISQSGIHELSRKSVRR